MLDSYNKGFMTKCVEYNIPFDTAFEMLKYAQARNEAMEKQAWNPGFGTALALQMAQKHVNMQQRMQDAFNSAPQLDQLQISSMPGYQQQQAANPTAVAAMNTNFKQPATPAAPAAAPAAGAAPAAAPAAGALQRSPLGRPLRGNV